MIETDIFNGKSPDLYLNLERTNQIPDRKSVDREAFIQSELKKSAEGITINGVFIPPTLYYDLNFHWIEKDHPTKGRTEGRPDLRDNNWILHNDLYIARKLKKHYCVAGSRQIGKELPDYQVVITEQSEKTIGEIKTGDKVFGKDGKLTTVLGVYPQGVKPIYRIYLQDGRTIDAGLEHNWEVYRRRKYKEILTTQQIINYQISHPYSSKESAHFYLPNIEEVSFSKKELPVNPYILGQLLGDGGLTMGTLTINSTDTETIDYFRENLPEYEFKGQYYEWKGKRQLCKHTIVYRGLKKYDHNKNPLKQLITKLGLNVKSQLKFIPNDYKYSSIEDRYEIVRGLMDSDGYISNKGDIEFKNSSEQLSNDLAYILRSLGIRCLVSKSGIYFRVHIRTDKPIFKLKRKLDKIQKRPTNNMVGIKKIEYLCDHTATCITVDNKDHIYLTKDFVPTHNSDTLTSLTLREIYTFENTTALLLFGGLNDKQSFSIKAIRAAKHVPEFLHVPNIDKSWDKTYIRFGFKETSNEDELHAHLYMYLTADGNAAQVGAGKTINFFAFDEIGKFPFKRSWNFVKPAMEGDYGVRNTAYFSFTGGETDKVADARDFFLNPEANKLLEFDVEGRKTGRFIGGLYRGMYKHPVTLTSYLNDVEKRNVSVGSEIDTLTIYASDFELANKKLDEELELLKLAGDMTSYNDTLTAYPRLLNHVFLDKGNNPFTDLIQEFEKVLAYLESNPPKLIDLHEVGENMEFGFSEKSWLDEYPISKNNDWKKDSAICMMDEPRLVNGQKLYVSGLDPYNTIKTATSGSLASMYVMRRATSDYTDPYGDRIVAWWNGRKDISTMRKNAMNLLKFYGAKKGGCTLLHEAADDNLTQWFSEKSCSYMLEDTYNLTKDITGQTETKNSKGIRPLEKVQKHYLQLILDYCEEELSDGKLGLWRIPDPYLIKQLISFNGDLSPCDAIVGFGHALMHLHKDRKFIPKHYDYSEEVTEKNSKNIFGYTNNSSTFTAPNKKSILS